MFNAFKYLLPKGICWNIVPNKNLRKFFVGLSNALLTPVKTEADSIWASLMPQETDYISKWEDQFGLLPYAYTTQQRRDRVEAYWSELGGNTPKHIEDALQTAGFDVYIHEWWDPGTLAVRDPLTYLWPSTDYPDPIPGGKGYPLVNKDYRGTPVWTTGCGESYMECGEQKAQCGDFLRLVWDYAIHQIPTGAGPYFMYVGAATFPNKANVDLDRKEEFENMLLKLCPANLWIGVLVNYT